MSTNTWNDLCCSKMDRIVPPYRRSVDRRNVDRRSVDRRSVDISELGRRARSVKSP